MKILKTSKAIIGSIVILFSLIIYSCSKDRIEEKSMNSYDSTNTNNYLDSKKQDEQEFTIDSTGSGPIVGNQGTTIWGSRTCLRQANGDTVTFPFTIKLVELYTPKDMIYYQMPTIASDTILITGGEIRLRAFKNGNECHLSPGCTYTILMPNAAPQSYMQVFNGVTVSNYINWEISSPLNTFSTNASGYTANIDQLGWINCDYKRGSATNSHLTFTSTTDNLTNVAIFAYFPTTKTVMQIYNQTSGSIPNGSDVKIIAIGVTAAGDLYHFYQAMTVNSSTSVNVTMTAITDANLTSLLNGL